MYIYIGIYIGVNPKDVQIDRLTDRAWALHSYVYTRRCRRRACAFIKVCNGALSPRIFLQAWLVPRQNRMMKSRDTPQKYTGILSVLCEITCIPSNTEKPNTDSNVGLCILNIG